MKTKIFILAALLSICVSVYAAGKVNTFSECLRDCSEYFSSQTVSLSSVNLTTNRQILGIDKENLCQYKEMVSSNDSVYTVTCKFNKEQRTSLANVLNDFDKNSDNNNIDLNDLTQVQNSKVYEAWSKYLQDESICKIETK